MKYNQSFSGKQQGYEKDGRLVIVRAFEDEPVKSVAVQSGGNFVSIARYEGGPEVRFPSKFVYRFEERRYDELVKAFTSKNRVALVSLWNQTPNGP